MQEHVLLFLSSHINSRTKLWLHVQTKQNNKYAAFRRHAYIFRLSSYSTRNVDVRSLAASALDIYAEGGAQTQRTRANQSAQLMRLRGQMVPRGRHTTCRMFTLNKLLVAGEMILEIFATLSISLARRVDDCTDFVEVLLPNTWRKSESVFDNLARSSH